MSIKEERDLVLAPNEFAYVLDRTKGNVDVYVGPNKASLSQTDQLVVFNNKTKRFVAATALHEAIQTFAIAPEGWYITLKNPSIDGKHPAPKTNNVLTDLNVGHKVNIPGPVSFALWPGQMIRVLKGHILRSNQYIIARVYDETAAKRDWEKAVVVPKGDDAEIEAKPVEQKPVIMGELLVIKGTDVSFFIPPSGIEVVKENDKYVRDAVTLERLEYCVLLDEDGNKRFVQGPAVVFPEPTEQFKTDAKGRRKFKAIELNELSGLYIKVVADYEDHKVGDELFITGKDQMIYFPREEHAIIKYGNQDIHYAVAIPVGEARYVLNRMTGEIKLINGPMMFLADPRKEVIVRRILDIKLAKLWFPNSSDAVAYNQALLDTLKEEEPTAGHMYMQDDYLRSAKVRDRMATYTASVGPTISSSMQAHPSRKSLSEIMADSLSTQQMTDEFQRKQQFTEPRTVVLDTKYDGAIPIDIWTGYAVLVVGRSGKREVVVGPKRRFLEYDEFLEKMSLSSGKPKNSDNLVEDVYLRVLHNKVSDIVSVETKDLVDVNIKLSYRVNFEGDETKWFDVENYVKFMTDHLRSLIKGVVKTHGIEDFYENSISILRDAILGTKGDGEERPGRLFKENGMRIYDVEILEVEIMHEDISDLLIDDQIDTVRKTLDIKSSKRELEFIKQREEASQTEARILSLTNILKIELDADNHKKNDELKALLHEIEVRRLKEHRLQKEMKETTENFIVATQIERNKEINNFENEKDTKQLELTIKELEAEVKAFVDKGNAFSPALIAALGGIVELGLTTEVAKAASIPALIGGSSVVEVFQKLFSGIPQLESALKRFNKKG